MLSVHLEESKTPAEALSHARPAANEYSPSGSDDSWKSCCLTTDRQAVVYLGQLTFSFTVLAFCGMMLYKANGSCEQSSPYIGLISFLLGKLLSSVTDSTRR